MIQKKLSFKKPAIFYSLLFVLLAWVPATYAMHIEDGILEPKWWISWYIVAALFIIPGLIEIKRRVQENLAYKPFLAMVGVAVFVISAMHLPVPVTGSCSHPCGTPLAAIIVGPFATVVLSVIALFFQAVFFAHGGITTIGANTFSMGICGCFAGYFSWKLLRSLKSPHLVSGRYSRSLRRSGDLSGCCLSTGLECTEWALIIHAAMDGLLFGIWTNPATVSYPGGDFYSGGAASDGQSQTGFDTGF